MQKIKKQCLLIYIFSLFIILCSCGGSKEDAPDSGYGMIYGAVTDIAQGNAVANANVSLKPGGETTLTGSDGIYEFHNVPAGNYSIVVSKSGYEELIDDYVIHVNAGRQARRYVQLRKLSSFIRITDLEGNDISSLDFGSESYVINKPFNIFNNRNENIHCEFIYSCNWIKSIYPIPDKIEPGRNVTINIEIDRAKLMYGFNETVVIIKSNDGSNEIKITAIGSMTEPIVQTLPATTSDGEINAFCNTFHGMVTEVGNPAYHSRGFCFSTENSTPTIDDNRINISGTGLGKFSYTYWNIPWERTRYYFRTWVMYGSDNKIIYGNVQSFVFYDI